MKAFNKDIARSVRHSLGRFIAIAAIVALGTGFYAGLRMTAPDMKMAADAYYDGTALMDIRVVSTLGLTDDDIQALRAVPGVQHVMPAYSADVLATLNGDQYVVRAHSLPAAAATSQKTGDAAIASDDGDYLNRLDLVEGRWPEAPGECVVFNDRVMSGPSELGDTITVDTTVGDVDDTLTRTEFTIVGRVHSPLYVSSTSMGTTTIGSGTIQQFMYLLPEDFGPDLPYVEAYVTVDGAAELPADSDAYEARVAEVVEAIEAIAPEREQARVAGLQAEAQEDLDEARAEYEQEEQRAQTELADARAQLDDAKAQLDEGQRKLDAAAATLAKSERDISDGEKEYVQGGEDLKDRRAQADAQFAEAQAAIDANEANLKEAQAALPSMQEALAQVTAALASPDLPADQRAALEAQKAELEKNIADIDQAATALAEAKQQMAAERAQADAQFAAAQKKLDTAQLDIEEGKKRLEEGKATYEQSKADLEAARAEYEQGVADYDAAATEANEQLDAAERELAEAQQKINDIEPPDWLVMDRSKNFGVVSFENDTERIDAIASFFPFIFFLVAALVALTTMTRMVEEERMLIGTFKALGYSRARITSKYLIYAALAAGVGSVVGIAVLSQVLPWVIMEAYSIVYYVPRGAMPVDAPIAAAAAGFGVGITLLATWAAAAATLRETPAALMRPPAPKAGKRILLERVGPLWRRLSFSWKVTFRNIFRYKRRLVMTCVGIAGCTALLLTGLGLQNSINDIIDVQYGELVDYNVVITEKDEATESQRAEAAALMDDRGTLPVCVRATEESMIAQGSDGTEAMTTIVAPADTLAFEGLWTFRTREGREAVPLTNDGAVITEKLASKLGLSIGGMLTFAEQDDLGNATAKTYQVPVAGIIENYIGDYAFVTSSTFQRVFGHAPENLTVYAQVTDDEAARQALSEALRATGAVDTVAYNDEVISSYKQMLRSVNMVVIVLVVAAAALAFIVLYNLTNINITERAREIATLKVLGFMPREVNAYIFREIVLLTVLGALVGLGLGVVLEGFVVVTAEVDQVMFGRAIHWDSFVIAFALTMVFTAVVMLVMRPKLAHINMVESLKSNE
ncbi:FtsX-like permease family protein [Adlercreutzia sp. R7]|uniref:FtsX-like permease family protein n=1 Tax=Adlercreutzia wanghongyangiae TaxID=3111451 RepID=A0ABU6IJ87_9ACTN|nr:FtsX-like permease family protein [Adlercreutzia sp. R7]